MTNYSNSIPRHVYLLSTILCKAVNWEKLEPIKIATSLKIADFFLIIWTSFTSTCSSALFDVCSSSNTRSLQKFSWELHVSLKKQQNDKNQTVNKKQFIRANAIFYKVRDFVNTNILKSTYYALFKSHRLLGLHQDI